MATRAIQPVAEACINIYEVAADQFSLSWSLLTIVPLQSIVHPFSVHPFSRERERQVRVPFLSIKRLSFVTWNNWNELLQTVQLITSCWKTQSKKLSTFVVVENSWHSNRLAVLWKILQCNISYSLCRLLPRSATKCVCVLLNAEMDYETNIVNFYRDKFGLWNMIIDNHTDKLVHIRGSFKVVAVVVKWQRDDNREALSTCTNWWCSREQFNDEKWDLFEVLISDGLCEELQWWENCTIESDDFGMRWPISNWSTVNSLIR